MSALSALEREALREILAEADIFRAGNETVLLSFIGCETLAALEAFEAEQADLEPNGDYEPSIGTHDDLEDDRSDDEPGEDAEQEGMEWPNPKFEPSPVVVNPAKGEKGRIVPVC